MINGWLDLHPMLYAVVSTLLTLALEAVIGEKRPLDAASLLKLLWVICTRLFQRTTSKGAPSVPTTNPNAIAVTVMVDGPTWNAGATIVDAAKKFKAGEKAQQVLAEELGPLLAQMSTLSTIPADFTGDPATVLNAVALRTVELEEVIRAKTAAK